MPRSVNAVASRARRKKVLKLAKGNFGSRGNVWTVAKNTVEKGLTYAYVGRKDKKRKFRSLWIQRINAAARSNGMTYSELMAKLKAKDIRLDRKVFGRPRHEPPEGIRAVVNTVKIAIAVHRRQTARRVSAGRLILRSGRSSEDEGGRAEFFPPAGTFSTVYVSPTFAADRDRVRTGSTA